MAAQQRKFASTFIRQEGELMFASGQPSGTAWAAFGDGPSHPLVGSDVVTSLNGNVHSFLKSVTPVVDLRVLQAPDAAQGMATEQGEALFFNLKDFWSSLEQWSCYGVGVPIQLDSGENVVQYYTPYLSGIQLFTRQEVDDADLAVAGADSSRNDSDFSDNDFRDSSSDSSDTSDRLQSRFFECSAALPSCLNKKESSDGSRSTASSEVDDTGSPSEAGLTPARDGSSSQELSWPTCVDCKGGVLCFQYFERDRPHMRLPICDQIRELQKAYPCLTTLRSVDLHPSSWISVAWYPVYMIPSSSSLKDVTASFLTFHGLSTELPPPGNSCPRCRDEFWAAPRIVPDPVDPVEDHVSRACKAIGISPPEAMDGLNMGHPHSRRKGRALLRPFGMCGYKVSPVMWPDIRQFESMKESAESWVKQMGVNHPDFTFFAQQSFM